MLQKRPYLSFCANNGSPVISSYAMIYWKFISWIFLDMEMASFNKSFPPLILFMGCLCEWHYSQPGSFKGHLNDLREPK